MGLNLTSSHLKLQRGFWREDIDKDEPSGP